MSDIYSDSVYVQIKSPCKKRFPSPLMFPDTVQLKLLYTVAVSYVNEVIIVSFSTYTVGVIIITIIIWAFDWHQGS